VPGDPVTLIGQQDGLRITAVQLAELADTIAYEIITGVSKRVPRIYVDRRP
jgi:alanine racemase